MTMEPETDRVVLTQILRRWREGDPEAEEHLFREVEKDLRHRARGLLSRERRNHTLQATELMQEAYLRLVDYRDLDWKSRSHFFAVACKSMRRILVDHARRRLAAKRGKAPQPVPLEDDLASVPAETDEEMLAVHEALKKLQQVYPRQEKVVEMRFFLGMKIHEIAEMLERSPATVKNELKLGRAWLYRELGAQSM